MNRVGWIALALVCCTIARLGHGNDQSQDKIDFVRDLQPIFQTHCHECHAADERNGGVSFDDLASLMAEADSGGFAVIAGHPEQSELVQRVRSQNDDDRMPPTGPGLTAEEIKIIERWIAQGAELPLSEGETLAASKSDHWSFRPRVTPLPPAVVDERWPKNGIDRFVQARRESAGLPVTSDADLITLVRRASYGLTGLPPSSAEVQRFLADSQSELGADVAWGRYVDELLSRPTYGERWGRHWMDWVRYADTAGDNSDFPIPQAYLYRNYLIDSFNEDVPYDRFLTEQIAGDLLPYESMEQRNRQRIGTGYLAMARRFGSLVERYPWHLTIEDTIDNLGRTMLGLTVACARCHDHKFDPVSTRDYYGLYGFFANTRYPMPGLELFQTQRDFVPLVPDEQAAELTSPYQQQTDQLTDELERLLAQCQQMSLDHAAAANQASVDEQRKMQDTLDALLIKARKAGEKLAEHLKSLPEFPTAYAVQDAPVGETRLQIKGEPDRLGAEVPRKFLDVLGGQKLPESSDPSTSGRLELAHWITASDNPLTARVIVNRVWQKHFGTGLVPSANDFGLRGEAPTHPQLLDYLANELIRSGWSIKHLHRLIMNSRTYRLASADLEENLAVDPGNQFYWKFNRQRLDAESIRDSLLWIAGQLDTTMPTEPHPFPPRQAWKFTQHHPFKDDYQSDQRSVYQMTKRLTAQSYYQTFDGADPNVCTSDRDQSVTALQALYFVNDPFLHQQAGRLAKRLLETSVSEEQQLIDAFERILCRGPSASEIDRLQHHLNSARRLIAEEYSELSPTEVELEVWASVIRSLMRLNEFMYVD